MLKFAFIIFLSGLNIHCYSQVPEQIQPLPVSDDITRISTHLTPAALFVSNASDLITSTIASCFNTSCGALAVQFLSFDAQRISGNEVEVTWKTTNEVNNRMFIVERSLGNSNAFKNAGRVDADNFQAAMHEYTFSDNNDFENISYYRLRQIDHDDKFMFSRIVAVKGFPRDEYISVFPNPARSSASLNVYLKNSEKGIVHVFNNQGQNVHEQTGFFDKGNNTIILNLEKLAKGFYVIKFYKSKGELLTTKFMKNY